MKRASWTRVMIGLLVGLPLAVAAAEQPPLRQFAQSGIQDLTLSLTLEGQQPAELRRMGKDFADLYRFGKARLRLMEPGRIRMDSRAGLISVVYVVNRDRKLYSIPGIGIRSVRDIPHSASPHQGLLDIGLISSTLADVVVATPLGKGTIDGTSVWRYAIVFTMDRFQKRQELSIDPTTRTVLERTTYHADGTVRARFRYHDPVQVAPGVWVPRRMELYSPRGKHAATTHYNEVRLNTGVDPEVFAF